MTVKGPGWSHSLHLFKLFPDITNFFKFHSQGASIKGWVGRWFGQWVGGSVGRSVSRSAGWSVGWSVGRSVGRLIGRSVGRSVGQFAQGKLVPGWSFALVFTHINV
jgi:hypothetical protein